MLQKMKPKTGPSYESLKLHLKPLLGGKGRGSSAPKHSLYFPHATNRSRGKRFLWNKNTAFCVQIKAHSN